MSPSAGTFTNRKGAGGFVVQWSIFTTQGQRAAQEDFYSVQEVAERYVLFMVSDGHGGSACAGFCAARFPELLGTTLESRSKTNRKSVHLNCLLKRSLAQVVAEWDAECCLGSSRLSELKDEEMRSNLFSRFDYKAYVLGGWTSGATVCCLLVDALTGLCYTLNLGDSKCVALVGGQEIETRSHSVGPLTEIDVVAFPSAYIADRRLCGDLAMSHSVGDNTAKLAGLVRREPDVQSFSVRQSGATVLLGTDGFFDEYPRQNLLAVASTVAAEDLCRGRTFRDNCTVINVNLTRTSAARKM